MDGICCVAQRIGKGGQVLDNGWKTPKFHLLLHTPIYHAKYPILDSQN